MAAPVVSEAPSAAPPAPPRRLGRRWHRVVLVIHVLTSVGWFGVAVTVAFVGLVGASRDDLAFTTVILSTLWLSVPLGLLSAASGAVLGLTTRWGLGRHWWVVGKELITVAVIATDVLVVAPTMADALDAGTPGELPGPIIAHCVVLAIATVLSIVKPKAGTPWASDRPRTSFRKRRPTAAAASTYRPPTGTTLQMELTVVDYGGNSDTVATQAVVP